MAFPLSDLYPCYGYEKEGPYKESFQRGADNRMPLNCSLIRSIIAC